MKIIIDIPEEVFERIKSVEDYYFRVLDDNKRILFPALKNGIPLDDIRAEIENNREQEEPHLCDYRYFRNEGLEVALLIIDKHIGEQI